MAAKDANPGVLPGSEGPITLLEEFSMVNSLEISGAAAVLNGDQHGVFLYQDLPDLERGFHGLGAFESGTLYFPGKIGPLAICCAWMTGATRLLVGYRDFPRVLVGMTDEAVCSADPEELISAADAELILHEAEILALKSRLRVEAQEGIGNALLGVEIARNPGLPGLTLEIVFTPCWQRLRERER